MMIMEQRVHFRMDLQSEAWLADTMGETWTPVTPLNMSIGGIAFASDMQLPADSLRRFRFHLPGNPKMINAVIKIGYSRSHAFLAGYRVGSVFASVKQADLDLIRQFIDGQSAPPSNAFSSRITA